MDDNDTVHVRLSQDIVNELKKVLGTESNNTLDIVSTALTEYIKIKMGEDFLRFNFDEMVAGIIKRVMKREIDDLRKEIEDLKEIVESYMGVYGNEVEEVASGVDMGEEDLRKHEMKGRVEESTSLSSEGEVEKIEPKDMIPSADEDMQQGVLQEGVVKTFYDTLLNKRREREEKQRVQQVRKEEVKEEESEKVPEEYGEVINLEADPPILGNLRIVARRGYLVKYEDGTIWDSELKRFRKKGKIVEKILGGGETRVEEGNIYIDNTKNPPKVKGLRVVDETNTKAVYDDGSVWDKIKKAWLKKGPILDAILKMEG